MRRYLPLLASITAATIFGFAFFFIKMGMAAVHQDSVKFLSFRFSLGFIVMNLMLLLRIRKAGYRGKPIALLIACGALNPLISQVLETTATTYAPTAQISVMTSVTPVLAMILSIFINREYPTRRQVFFMIVAVAGVASINLIGGRMRGGTTTGLILILLFVSFLSVQRVLIRRASEHFTPFETIYVSTGMGAIGFTALSLIKSGVQGGLDGYFACLLIPEFVISILYMGVLSCVVAFLYLTYAAGNLPIAVSGAMSTLSTVITVLVGVFALGEHFRSIDIAGTAVILAGIIGICFTYDRRGIDANRLANMRRGR